MDGLKRIFTTKAKKYGIDVSQLKFEFTCDPPEPGKAICATAKKYHVQLIIMGSRGLSKFKKALIGSVSDHVLRNSGIPVLTVPFHK